MSLCFTGDPRYTITFYFTFYSFHLNLTRAKTAVVLFVVDHAELSGSHTMDFLIGMDDVATFASMLHRAGEILRCVTDLECHTGLVHFCSEKMEVVDCEVLFVGCLRVIRRTMDRHRAPVPCVARWCGTTVRGARRCVYPSPIR